jgi:hypothetical protein
MFNLDEVIEIEAAEAKVADRVRRSVVDARLGADGGAISKSKGE